MTSYAAEFAVNSVLIFEEKNRIDRNPRTFDATFIKKKHLLLRHVGTQVRSYIQFRYQLASYLLASD